MTTAEKFHDFSAGHRVTGHEGKCRSLHGHNYRVTFICTKDTGLDNIGRVIDFGDIDKHLCSWLESNWDHKFLIWADDPLAKELKVLDPIGVILVPFNPTAENMAGYLVDVVGPSQLVNTGVKVVQCRVEETRKCAATYSLES